MTVINRVAGLFDRTKKTVAGHFGAIKAAYNAALPSRFRRERHRIGGTADAHYSIENEYWKVREYVRDMDRNDAVIGQLVSRAVDNIIGCGFRPIPQSGDPELDQEIYDRWMDWAGDPFQCDVSLRHTFNRMERLALRSMFVDGDCFAVPTSEGRVQLLEGDWVNSPSNQRDGVIHGVRVNELGAPVEYWLVKPRLDEREVTQHRLRSNPEDFTKRPAFDRDGNPLILHIYDPKRITQSRGISAFAPVFDIAGMLEDANFAKLVQQQISSCIAMFIERTSDFQFGGRTTITDSDSTSQILEELQPGIVVRGKPGESMKAFAPNVTPSEWFDHVKMLLRMIGANLGMPLSLVLLDTSDTTFHGYRGELNQARIGFRCIQRLMVERFHSPIFRWKMREWYPDRPEAQRHRWGYQAWPYIEPLTDAKADAMRLENLLVSPRELHNQRGSNWVDTVRETVEDRVLAIKSAIEASQDIEESLGVPVDWRDILNLKTPSGVNVSADLKAQNQPQEPEQDQEAPDGMGE